MVCQDRDPCTRAVGLAFRRAKRERTIHGPSSRENWTRCPAFLFPDDVPFAWSRTVPPTTPSSSLVVSSSPFFLAGSGVGSRRAARSGHELLDGGRWTLVAEFTEVESGKRDGGVEFVAVDNPHMNKLTIHILAAVAEHEREIISERTKAALQAAKARGRVLYPHWAAEPFAFVPGSGSLI
jgi:Resolvase, N terminal domain